jgi:HAD superfamily phosphatase (TIGR01681 family)
MGIELCGREIECVVFGLDGTIWGGAVAEDGVEGIEPFLHMQAYLKQIHAHGVHLAVASKNETQDALAPFGRHPGMQLDRGDIDVFLANWNDKAENIRAIQKALKVPLASMLFLDDDPFERAMVRGLLPEVAVMESPLEPDAVQSNPGPPFANADAFLQSLDMRIVTGRFDSAHLSEIARFMERNRQFHLTANCYTESECESLIEDPAVLPLHASLSDRLGDHGLAAVILLAPGYDEMVIRDWIMSRRFMGRGVEQCLMNLVVEEAQRRNCTRVSAEYIRSARNEVMSDFYAQFGFTMIGDDPRHTMWLLPVMAYESMPTFIRAGTAAASSS